MGLKVLYMPQLSDIAVNKDLQKRQDLMFAQFLLQTPEVMQDPIKKRAIMEILVRNEGGQWEKNLNKILGEVQPLLPEGVPGSPGRAQPGAFGGVENRAVPGGGMPMNPGAGNSATEPKFKMPIE